MQSDKPLKITIKLLLTPPLLFCVVPGVADVELAVNPETGLKSWTLNQGALELELVQRLPDQTRAFFLARGFPAKTTDEIARSCVLQTIGRNSTDARQPVSVTIDLAQWRIVQQGRKRPVKLKEAWAKAWRNDSQIPDSAKLAFRWATFPTVQTYEPAQDYNWGMISFGPKPGETMDINIVWQENGQKRSAVIKGVTCPLDR